ncbi:L,D-transpeptidase [Thiomicrorhabdus indica]|uniref:L,D-transpeptidase n=1 Tax=Thiomicrorhabdus indica TaxID=2267253 RepID=UPI001F10AF15|nr:L,D-transpeptidase [Thiomicrorhabdus indica]
MSFVNDDRPVNLPLNLGWPNYVTCQQPNIADQELFVVVSITEQKVYVCKKQVNNSMGFSVLWKALVSTGKAGVGNLSGSGQTPLGWHRIKAKIGEGLPENSVFVGRRATGEIFTEKLSLENPDRDWILTRILWLTGCQKGFNRRIARFGQCDTLARYIYFHGSGNWKNEPAGKPYSHGCIRLHNNDLLKLFNMTSTTTNVLILEPELSQLKALIEQNQINGWNQC